jgi:alkylresorcinol/alkylpyrone synthase
MSVKPLSPNMSPKILGIETSLPPYEVTLEALLPWVREWVKTGDPAFQDKVERIFRHAEVDRRYTVLPLDEIFRPRSFAAANQIYRTEIVPLAENAVRKALAATQLEPTEIDCLIVTSCTGHMSPSLDAFLINRLGMRTDVQRMPVMEMGCIGGAVGLMYAENYLRAYPHHKVALVAAELTSVTFQREDFSWANIVSSAIFGDGVACAILGQSEKIGPRIVASRMHHFPDSIDLLGFDLSDSGFRMVLAPELPDVIRANFHEFMAPLLQSIGWCFPDVEQFIVHPGGKKILHNVELQLRKEKGVRNLELTDSRSVLREMGNMSSATVLFILQRLLARPIPTGEKGMLLGFGPGLTAASCLLEWS